MWQVQIPACENLAMKADLSLPWRKLRIVEPPYSVHTNLNTIIHDEMAEGVGCGDCIGGETAS